VHVTLWGQGEGHIGFWWINLRERDNFKDCGVGRIILKLIFKKKNGGVEWIDLADDRQRWWAIIKALMNLRYP
jgi:hypothetical protein